MVSSGNHFTPILRFGGTFRPKRGARNAYHTISRPTKCSGTKKIADWSHYVKMPRKGMIRLLIFDLKEVKLEKYKPVAIGISN